MLDLTIGQKQNIAAADQLIAALKALDLTGSLYIGYPLLASADEALVVDALLICVERGIVAFEFDRPLQSAAQLDEIVESQDELFTSLEIKLKQFKQLVKARKLLVDINIITLVPSRVAGLETRDPAIATADQINSLLQRYGAISQDLYEKTEAAIQRVTTIKPTRKRTSVKRDDSRGAILKQIEGKIANLDQWQKKGAIEYPEGVQRIRGLAGSGKTIVLALKAAYLHALHPDWNIVVTFHTRSLSQQLKDLIRRFTFEHKNDEPDWEKLRVIHTWGSTKEPGVYSEIALAHGKLPKSFMYGRQKFNYEAAFDGVCRELIEEIGSNNFVPQFDAVLIDEAQDLPHSFFELIYLSTHKPKRIVYAYDELQNLSDYSMDPPSILFGANEDGSPRVAGLFNADGQPKQDIVLPVCYRNTPWALSVAHALGFGIYRKEGLVQFFDYPELLKEVGYTVLEGSLSLGSKVRLKRTRNATPSYFSGLLNPNDAIQFQVFDSREDQASELAKKIKEDLEREELEYRDILVIICNPLTMQEQAAIVIAALTKEGLPNHLAGVSTSRDILFKDESIAITNIYRAKGNEAAMVYVLNSEYGFSGLELERRRNILFTAITRSKAWVRIFGCGPEMQGLIDEASLTIKNDYEFRFRIPTAKELEKLRKIHRDRTTAEKQELQGIKDSLNKLLDLVNNGDIDIEQLSPVLRKQLQNLLEGPKDAAKRKASKKRYR